MLNTILHGDATNQPPLLIAHGLYGSGRNWGVIAKRLSDSRQVIAVDMRNHGLSARTETHTYADMASDLAEVVTAHSGHDGRMDVLGHSMGGKASMMLSLTRPDLVNRLVVADIAPAAYTHSQAQFITAMRSVDLTRVERRSDAEAQLADAGVPRDLQSFFTQSLDIPNKAWRLNLDTLGQDMAHIVGFPDGITSHFEGATLFLSGANSDYVLPEHRQNIRALFPNSHFAKIPGAGHWLHAEKPREFEAAVRVFLNN
jgi:pimeloyl-ACP methyl ester carboxylesterase